MSNLTKREKLIRYKSVHDSVKRLMTKFIILICVNIAACVAVNFMKASQSINIALFGLLGAITAITLGLLITRLVINHKINSLEYFNFYDGDRLDTVVISGCNSSQLFHLPLPAPTYSDASKRPPSYVSASGTSIFSQFAKDRV